MNDVIKQQTLACNFSYHLKFLQTRYQADYQNWNQNIRIMWLLKSTNLNISLFIQENMFLPFLLTFSMKKRSQKFTLWTIISYIEFQIVIFAWKLPIQKCVFIHKIKET